MLTPEERTTATNIAGRLIDLYTRRGEACGQEDWHRVRRLEHEISQEAACRRAIIGRGESPRRN
jgi:hypothetical protein